MLIWIIVAAYLLLVLGISIRSSVKIKHTADFMLAGRQIGPLVLAGTLAATCIDGGSTIGVAANTYSRWGASAIWYNLAIGASLIVLGLIAPKLRSTGVRTVPEYFRIRYGKTAGVIESMLTLVSLIGITSAQISVSASILRVMLGMDYYMALFLMAVLICAYAVLGGMWGVALTDVLQLVTVIAGMCLAVPFALHMAGGWSGVTSVLSPETMHLTSGIGGWKEILAYFLLFVMAVTSGEQAVSACLGADSGRTIRIGSAAAGVLVLLFSVIPVVLGLTSLALYQNGSLSAEVMEIMDRSGKFALPAMAQVSMPKAVSGILFAGIVAAAMSSADLALLGAGSVYSNDCYHVYINPSAHGRENVAAARLAMVLGMLASFTVAIYSSDILATITISLSLQAAGSFFPYVFGHIWKRASREACLGSLIIGTGWYLLKLRKLSGIPQADSILSAAMAGAIAFFFLSWLFPGRSQPGDRKEEEKTERKADKEAKEAEEKAEKKAEETAEEKREQKAEETAEEKTEKKAGSEVS